MLELDDWVQELIPELVNSYSPLAKVLQHNASGQPMQPIESALTDLVNHLRAMQPEELSSQQMRVLDEMDVGHLIGNRGAYWVERVVKTSTYDPATTAKKVGNAVSSLTKSLKEMQSFVNSAKNLGFYLEDQDMLRLQSGRFRVSICFQQEVGINSVPDLKNRSNDWFQIINGVAQALGEKPEDTKVGGVANGSTWVILGATAALTKALAIISKHAREISSNAFGILHDIEDYRNKRRMNKHFEKGFALALDEVKDKGLESLMEELSSVLPESITPEKTGRLKLSVEKLLNFIDKGGDVDFSAPVETSSEDEDFDADAAAIVSEVKRLIEDAQRAKHAARLIEKQVEDKSDD